MRDDIARLCREAQEYRLFAVCLAPCHVSFAVAKLSGSAVRLGTVVGFPNGDSTTQAKVDEAARALDAGAVEIDMVMRIGAVRDGNLTAMGDDVACVAQAVHRYDGALLKVILETALLTPEETVAACRTAVASDADFVKTSTGFSPAGGATIDAVRLMRETVGDAAGVKAAGGIRDYRAAAAMIAAGATRIGSSASVAIVREEMEQTG